MNEMIANPYSPVNAPAYDKHGGIHFSDQIGTTRALMTEPGSLARARDYAPYGEALADSGGSSDSFYRFGGKIHHPNIGKSYFPYRYYSPAQARWTMRDPLGMVDGPNVFAYVGGDPVSRVDAHGTVWIPVAWGCGVGVVSQFARDAIRSPGMSGSQRALRAACACAGGAVSGLGTSIGLGAATGFAGGAISCACGRMVNRGFAGGLTNYSGEDFKKDAACCAGTAAGGALGGALGRGLAGGLAYYNKSRGFHTNEHADARLKAVYSRLGKEWGTSLCCD